MTRMRKTPVVSAAVLALFAGTAIAQQPQKTVKIGFISTFGGPVAAIGNDMKNSFELALDHHGRKLGGLPVEVIYEDDQFKPEVGVQKTQKLIEFRSRRFRRRLYLVERAARVAKTARRFQDHDGRDQCRPVAARRRIVFALCVLDVMEQRPDAVGSRSIHE